MTLSGRSVHSVHVYSDSSALISRLCGIVSSSLQVGDAVLVVATTEHRNQLVSQLQNIGVNVRGHARAGLYTMIDAEEMLTTFMVDGMPDPSLFAASVGSLLQKARKAAQSKSHGLTVFGEMVAVLWDQGNKDAALQLEALWNDALNGRSFHLHCAYPRWGFVNAADEAAVYGAHSHVIH